MNRKSLQPAPLAIDPGAANVVTPAANGTSPRIFHSLDHSIKQLAGLKDELEGHPPQEEWEDQFLSILISCYNSMQFLCGIFTKHTGAFIHLNPVLSQLHWAQQMVPQISLRVQVAVAGGPVFRHINDKNRCLTNTIY